MAAAKADADALERLREIEGAILNAPVSGLHDVQAKLTVLKERVDSVDYYEGCLVEVLQTLCEQVTAAIQTQSIDTNRSNPP